MKSDEMPDTISRQLVTNVTGKFRTILVLFITWILFFATFFAYEKYYVRHEEEYFREEGFRVLGTLEAQLRAILEQTADTISSCLKLLPRDASEDPYAISSLLSKGVSHPESSPPPYSRQKNLAAAALYFRTYLSRVSTVPPQHRVEPEKCADLDLLTLKWIATPGPFLEVQCRVNPELGEDWKYGGIAKLNLESWIRSSFSSLDREYFDSVLIADSTGEVLYESGPTNIHLREIQTVEPFTIDSSQFPGESQIAGLSAEQSHFANGSGNTEAIRRAHSLRDVSGATTVGRISVDGEDYILFTEPIRDSPQLTVEDSSGNARVLILCGLVRASRFQVASHALSYTTLIRGALILLTLFSLSWPLFKLEYMNSKERFRAKHGAYLCGAILAVAACVTLMVINECYLATTADESDVELRSLAGAIKQNVTSEFERAFTQLNNLGPIASRSVKRTPVTPPADRSLSLPKEREYVLGHQLCYSVNIFDENTEWSNCTDEKMPTQMYSAYGYFELALWSDCQGTQLVKLTARPVPTISISEMPAPNFARSLSATRMAAISGPQPWRKNWSNEGGERGCAASSLQLGEDEKGNYVDELKERNTEVRISTNTGENVVFVSSPFVGDVTANKTDKKIAVQAIAFRPMALIDPVLPPHFSFAVIDHNCRVLFHESAIRNLRENFCDNSRDSAELAPWLRNGADQPLTVTYQGSEERAFITTLPIKAISTEGYPDGKAYLIVFREPGVDSAVDVAIMLLCAVPLGLYFIAIFTMSFVYLGARSIAGKNYPPEAVWPDLRKAGKYSQVAAFNFVAVGLFWVFYGRLYQARVVVLAFVILMLVILFTICKTTSLLNDMTRFFNLRRVVIGCRVLAIVPISIFIIECAIFLDQKVNLNSFAEQTARETVQQDLIIISIVVTLEALLIASLRRHFTLPDSEQPFWFAGLRPWQGAFQGFMKKHFFAMYASAAMSLVIAVAVMPTIATYKYSYDLVTEFTQKHQELMLSDRLIQRYQRLRSYYADVVDASGEIVQRRFEEKLDRYDQYNSQNTRALTVNCIPSLEACSTVSVHQSRESASLTQPLNKWVAAYLVNVLKVPDSAVASEISAVAATSNGYGRWENFWEERGVGTFALLRESDTKFSGLTIVSKYPGWSGMTWPAVLVLALILGCLTLWLFKIMKNIFPRTRNAPIPPREVDWTGCKEIARDSVVIGQPQSGKTDRMLNLEPKNQVLYVDLREVGSSPTPDANALNHRDSAVADATDLGIEHAIIVFDHFESALQELTVNPDAIRKIEDITRKATVKRVVLSTIDPSYYFGEELSEITSREPDSGNIDRLLDHWRHTFRKFDKVQLSDPEKARFLVAVRHFTQQHKSCGEERGTTPYGGASDGDPLAPVKIRANCQSFGLWVFLECRSTHLLRELGTRLIREYKHDAAVSREDLVRQIRTLADWHYRAIWADLSARERVILYQLALDGWANPHLENEQAIEQLQLKGLVYKHIMFRVMNQSFCDFIASPEHASEIAELEKEARKSVWQATKLVLIACSIGLLMWLLYAEADLFRLGSGYVAAICTLLTAGVNFFAGAKRPIQGASNLPAS
jgi:hypothetical protein